MQRRGQQQQQRQTLKGASASTQRRHMNQRRQDLSSKIRKARRSHTVQLKRRAGVIQSSSGHHDVEISSSTTVASAGAVGSLPEVAFCKSPNADTLHDLQLSIASSPTRQLQFPPSQVVMGHGRGQLDDISQGQGQERSESDVQYQFVQTLGGFLTSTDATLEMRFNAARIITNLAAMDSPSSSDHTKYPSDNRCSSYYGRKVESWCDFMTRSTSNVLPSLIHIVVSSAAITITATPDDTTNNTSAPSIILSSMEKIVCSQCCWAIGNIAGDSQAARDAAIQQHGVILPLIAILRKAVLYTSTQRQRQQRNSNTTSATTNDTNKNELSGWTMMARNSAWALANLARGSDTSSIPFLQQQSSLGNTNTALTTNDVVGNGLTAQDFIKILSMTLDNNTTTISTPQPTAGHNDLNDVSPGGETIKWSDVTIEVFWMLAFLTAREDEGVDILFATGQQGMFDLLIQYLHLTTNVLLGDETTTAATAAIGGIASPNMNTDNDSINTKMESATRLIIPVIRTIGNVATASGGRHVPMLLQTKTTVEPSSLSTTSSSMLCHTLARWMKPPSTQPSSSFYDTTSFLPDHNAIATEIAWVTGTLLCDAGISQHPSTFIACPILIPALSMILVGNEDGGSGSGRSTSSTIKIDLKREVLSAIWNALSQPPPPSSSFNSTTDETLGVRDEILIKLFQTTGLVKLLIDSIQSSYYDIDVLCNSLKIIDAMHRRLLLTGSNNNQKQGTISATTSGGCGRYDSVLSAFMIQQVFDEADCANILEGVCDRASASASYGSAGDVDFGRSADGGLDYCAEIAANLIDDFYAEEMLANGDDDYDFDGIANQVVNNEKDQQDQFPFGISMQTDSTVAFDFGSSAPPVDSNANTTTSNFINSVQTSGNPNSGAIGRGRGKVLPAWMQQQQK